MLRGKGSAQVSACSSYTSSAAQLSLQGPHRKLLFIYVFIHMPSSCTAPKEDETTVISVKIQPQVKAPELGLVEICDESDGLPLAGGKKSKGTALCPHTLGVPTSHKTNSLSRMRILAGGVKRSLSREL